MANDPEKTKKIALGAIAGLAILGVGVWLASYYELFGGKPVETKTTEQIVPPEQVEQFKKEEAQRLEIQKKYPPKGA